MFLFFHFVASLVDPNLLPSPTFDKAHGKIYASVPAIIFTSQAAAHVPPEAASGRGIGAADTPSMF